MLTLNQPLQARWCALPREHVATARFRAGLKRLVAHAAILPDKAGPYADLQQEKKERKRAEQALGQSEQRFCDYAETAFDCLWETGLDHRFTYVSGQLRAFGIDPARLIGKRRFDVASDQEAESQKWREHMASLERQEPFRNFEYAYRDVTGDQRHVRVNGRPVFSADRSFMGYRGTTTDLTSRHEAEERLRQWQKIAAIGQLTGGVAHDFNNILTVITGTIEILKEGFADRPQLAAIGQLIDDAATRGAEITSQLLACAPPADGAAQDRRQSSSDRNSAVAQAHPGGNTSS